MATLAEIRAKLLAQDSKSADNANANRGVDAIYPFWNMDTDSTSVIRFLPDADQSNTFFWRQTNLLTSKTFLTSKNVFDIKNFFSSKNCFDVKNIFWR